MCFKGVALTGSPSHTSHIYTASLWCGLSGGLEDMLSDPDPSHKPHRCRVSLQSGHSDGSEGKTSDWSSYTTLITLVGFLSCVDSLIWAKRSWGLAEALLPFSTFIGFLSCVNPLMNLKIKAPTEALPHSSHLNGFSPTCEPFGGLEGVNSDWSPSHTPRTCVVSPVWTLWQCWRYELRLKPFHMPHTLWFSPVWTLWWAWRYELRLKPLSHSSHL